MSFHPTRLGISRPGSQPTRPVHHDGAGVCRRIYPQIETDVKDAQATRAQDSVDAVEYQMPGAYPTADDHNTQQWLSAVATPASQPVLCARRLWNGLTTSAMTGFFPSGLHDEVHALERHTEATQAELARQTRHARLDAAINRKPSILSPTLRNSAISQIADYLYNVVMSQGASMAVAASTIEQSCRTFRLKEDVEVFKLRLPDSEVVGAYMNRERGHFSLSDASLKYFNVLDFEMIVDDAERAPLSGKVSLGVQNNRFGLTAIFKEAFDCRTQEETTNQTDFLTWLEAGQFGNGEDIAVDLFSEALVLERARCHVCALVQRDATHSAVIEADPARHALTHTVDEGSNEWGTQDQALFLQHVESMGLYR